MRLTAHNPPTNQAVCRDLYLSPRLQTRTNPGAAGSVLSIANALAEQGLSTRRWGWRDSRFPSAPPMDRPISGAWAVSVAREAS
jgi:hypothetical protein